MNLSRRRPCDPLNFPQIFPGVPSCDASLERTQMDDAAIIEALRSVGAEWLMDPDDSHCQSAALRHLVAVATAKDRERCMRIIDSMTAYTGGHGEPRTPGGWELQRAIAGPNGPQGPHKR